MPADGKLRQVIDEMESERLIIPEDGDAAQGVDGDEEEEEQVTLVRSTSPTPSRVTLRYRRRTWNWTVFVATMLFIFWSIAFIVLYFAVPRLIKAKYLDPLLGADADGDWRERVLTESVSIRNVTDKAIDLFVETTIKTGEMPIGISVEMSDGHISHQGRKVAEYALPFIYIPRAVSMFRSRIPVRIVITDPDGFGSLVNDLLVEEQVQLGVDGNLIVKPDWLPSLPATPLQLKVPIEGGPKWLRKGLESSADDLAIDLIEGLVGQLRVRVRLTPSVSVTGHLPAASMIVESADKRIARVYSPPVPGAKAGSQSNALEAEAIVGPFTQRMRDLITGANGKVIIKGDCLHSHPFLRPLLKNLAVPLTVPGDARYAFPLVKEVVLLDLFGSTASVTSNPFSLPVHVHSLDSMTVRYEEKVIARLAAPCVVDAVIPPKTKMFKIEQPRGTAKLKYEGGVSTAIGLMRAILKKGYIEVDIEGQVSVSLGDYRADLVPVAQKRVRVSSKRTAQSQFPEYVSDPLTK